MIYKVITKYSDLTRIHFRSHCVEDCWRFIGDQKYPYTNLKYIVVDAIDRVIKPKIKKENHDQNITRNYYNVRNV